MTRARAALVGGFVVGALLIAMVGIVILGSGRLFNHKYLLVAYFRSTVHGLDKGAPVKFKGVEIGSVYDIFINLSKSPIRPEDARIPVLLALDERKLHAGGAPHLDLDEKDNVKTLVDQGLRAQLGTISYVTGLRY